MKLSTFLHDHYLIAELQEEKLTTSIAPALKSQFVYWNAEGRNNIILDLSAVSYADSSGLSALLNARRLFNAAGGIFILCGLTPHVEKLIKISMLDAVLNILPTRQEAIEAVFMHDMQRDIEEEEGEETTDNEAATDSPA